MKNILVIICRLTGLLMFTFTVAGCASHPDQALEPTHTASLAFDPETPLGMSVNPVVKQHPGESGFSLLDTGRQAFLARANLIETAQRSIDAQYYIWNSDASGRYLARRLLAAADRGVRVRLLLDDINVGDRRPVLAAMSLHPNIEVRIYNPVSREQGLGKNLALVRDFKRINRRMHNKTFIADSAWAVVGGRNIGDEYFDLHDTMNHRDRDILAVGPIVENVAENFDDYWNTTWAIPIENLGTYPVKAGAYTELNDEEWLSAVKKALVTHKPTQDPEEALRALEIGVAGMIWAPAELVYDAPVTDMSGDSDQPMETANALSQLVQSSESEVLIESAYFVLAEPQLDLLDGLRQRGVGVKAITNSLATNDLTSNHAAYARWRESMVRRGIELYELRPDAQSCSEWIENPEYCGDGRVSLHAKSAVFDRKVVFIGSFNVNLRSIYLNGETVLIIHSRELSEQVARDIELAMNPENSWQVIDDNGRLEWVSENGETWTHEPTVGLWRRLKSRFISVLPIEKYL